MFFLKDLPTKEMLNRYQAEFPGMDVETVGSALQMLRSASILLRELDRYFAKHDFSLLRFLILIVLDRDEKRAMMTIGEVAESLDVSRPVATRTIQSLIDDGLLTAIENEKDGRSMLLKCARGGHKKLRELLPGYYEVIQSPAST